MPIVYALIARGKTVLAEYTSTSGNFPTVTRVLLSKISPQDNKMSYVYDKHVFHYIVQNSITFLCMADEDFTRRVPFMFLENIRQLFLERYGDRARTAIAFAMNEEFSRVLQTQLEYYNSDPSADNIGRVRSQINDVKDVMVQNIEKVLERGEKIELLVDKTDRLNQQAFKFEKQSKRLKTAMWWKNCKMTIILTVVVLAIIYLVLSMLCGSKLEKCLHRK